MKLEFKIRKYAPRAVLIRMVNIIITNKTTKYLSTSFIIDKSLGQSIRFITFDNYRIFHCQYTKYVIYNIIQRYSITLYYYFSIIT